MKDTLTERARNVAERFAIAGKVASVAPMGKGRINDTFLVTTGGGERYVLQKVNPIFAPSVLEDIDVLTRDMKQSGFTTPELVPTKAGELGVVENGLPAATTTAQAGECWRMLTYIDGRTIEEGVTEKEARSAMTLVGNFHQAFADHDHEFRHVRAGFHDTPRIMEMLAETTRAYSETKKDESLSPLSALILSHYAKTPHAWAHLPKRIIHGDPKLNNVRFAEHSDEAIALLDLDTLGRHSVVIDIADAARSWCNRADEGDVARAEFDLDIFSAMMEGYARKAKFLTKEERVAIPFAIAQIALELAARFATDAYRESYFTLDRERYPDLFTQNSAKARAQFALYRDIVGKLHNIADLTAHT